jgi:predicted Zn finger-like uncharacterized protein
MLTRCPECATRFRVRPEQLRVAEGRVRCGRCGSVFHAEPAVAAEAGPAAAEPAPSLLTEERRPDTEPKPKARVASAAPRGVPARSARARRGRGGVGWALGAGLLVIALAVQWVWWQRASLSAHPEGFRLVRLLCAYAPCSAVPPRAPESIQVLDRSLTPHPTLPDALRFHLRMVNQGPVAQPFPLVELRLFDRNEGLAAVGRFAPESYLTGDPPPSGLMRPAVPVEVDLDLADPGTHVIGFQIDFL